MKKQDEDSITVKLSKQIADEIAPLVDTLGLSPEAAIQCALVVSAMRVGVYKTKAAYVKAIRESERMFKVKLMKHMPPYIKGGDPKYIEELKGLA